MSAISYGLRVLLPSEVQIVRAGEPPTERCRGSVEFPSAAPATLCLYESASVNTGGSLEAQRPLAPGTIPASGLPLVRGVTQEGAVVTVRAAAPGDFISAGSWAARPVIVVEAPE